MKISNKIYFGLSLILLGIFMLLITVGHVRHLGALLPAAVFFAAAVVFAGQFLRDDRRWWAVIPAGITFTLGTLVLLDTLDLMSAPQQWVVFFLGIALTFTLLWTRRKPENRWFWPIYPAVASGLTAMFCYLGSIRRLDGATIAALLIMAAGAWLLVRALRS